MKKRNVKETLAPVKAKLARGLILGETAVFMLANTLTASASSVTVIVDENVSMDNIMGNVIGLLLDIMRWVGVGFLVWGIYQLYTSYTENNPDGKIKGITYCVVAIGLITIKSILKTFNIIA